VLLSAAAGAFYPDLVVAFNSGLHTPHDGAGWRPTVRALVAGALPCLFTSFNSTCVAALALYLSRRLLAMRACRALQR
jgi:hypothetical protein